MVYDTNDFLIDHFNVAMRIHAITHNNGLDDAYARLLVYVHIKTLSSPAGIEALQESCETEIDALQRMLGNNATTRVSRELALAEFEIQERTGMESSLRPELKRRLQFHTDAEFRQKVLGVYSMLILPQLTSAGTTNLKNTVLPEKNRLG